ncbi:MAG: TetR-like C-terminal domain-containing protein [Clostridia bacterium]|nr:TetR-like C-terminal domain-containing protein [Clostridia bacterium]
MENQRVRLSKTMLKNALIELLRTKSLEKITIYELCNVAQINRTTFYKYYGNQYDLLSDIENDIFSELNENLLAPNRMDLAMLSDVIEYLEADRDKWRILINSVDDQAFINKLFALPRIHEMVRENAPMQYSERMEEYVRLFYCQGGYAIIRKWLNDENPESPAEIAALLISLVSRVV